MFADGWEVAVVVLAIGAAILGTDDDPPGASPVGAIETRLSLPGVVSGVEVDGMIGAVAFDVSAAVAVLTVDCPGRLVSFRGSER